jgi:hypothetical protein
MPKKKRKKRVPLEPICKNCRLYDPRSETCKVTILLDGRRYNLPVSPEDHCHMDELGIEVKEVRFWVEDPLTGEKTGGDGVVKIQYPEGFFGEPVELQEPPAPFVG